MSTPDADCKNKSQGKNWGLQLVVAVFILAPLGLGLYCIFRQEVWASPDETEPAVKFIGSEAVAIGLTCIMVSVMLAAVWIKVRLKDRGLEIERLWPNTLFWWPNVILWVAIGIAVICFAYASLHRTARQTGEKMKAREEASLLPNFVRSWE